MCLGLGLTIKKNLNVGLRRSQFSPNVVMLALNVATLGAKGKKDKKMNVVN